MLLAVLLNALKVVGKEMSRRGKGTQRGLSSVDHG
jgi:hypothetical protein